MRLMFDECLTNCNISDVQCNPEEHAWPSQSTNEYFETENTLFWQQLITARQEHFEHDPHVGRLA